MKRTLIFVLGATAVFGMYAQTKLDAASRTRLRGLKAPYELAGTREGTLKAREAVTTEPVLRAFINLTDETSGRTALETAGATVRSCRGGMALAEFPESALESIEALPQVKSITIEKHLDAKLDKAREVSGIDKIHSGLDLPQAYTGEGVVCGIVDGGFDPMHLNFLDENGEPRIGQFTYFRPTQTGDYVQQVVPRERIKEIDTESSETFHGTHTTGIMAGGYRGEVKAGVKKDGFQGEIRRMANPYYGVAYNADIAAAAGSTSDYHIALGIEDILNYAYDADKPAVINLSLGSNMGPHDGSSSLCRYLDAVSEMDRVVFCISAGNEGDYPIAINKTFTEEDNSVKTFVYPYSGMSNYPNLRYGTVYIYSNDSAPFEVQIQVYNKKRGSIARRYSMKTPEDGSTIDSYWVSSAEYQGADTDIIDPQFARYFKGYIGIGSERDSFSGRSYAVLDMFCWDNIDSGSSNSTGTYTICFEVIGQDGQRIDIFSDGTWNSLTSYGIEGFTEGSSDGTISDIACGNNCVVVGSYNTRDDWASLDGYVYGYRSTFPEGKCSSFSSWGTLFDGRQRPTVCAPGAAIISSSNEYYLEAQRAGDENRQASAEANGRIYSWHQCVGTSMSSPLVAGSIALWLEADPMLKYNDVLDIIKTTAVRDEDVTTHEHPVQWGAGKFDAYAGLKEVLRRQAAGIGNINTETGGSRLSVASSGDRVFTATLDGSTPFSARLYNMGGSLCGCYTAPAGEAVIDASALPAGVYILKADNGAAAVRVLVK